MLISMLSAGIIIALLSLVGSFFFGTQKEAQTLHRFVLPAAVGVFLGVVFFELIPETLEASQEWGPVVIVFGFLGFYLLSHVLETYHHHHGDEHDRCAKNGARKLLIGDSIHNFADGVVIASAFMIDPTLGVLTTAGIALHEIPQEIAEFGILIQSGLTRRRALFLNTLSALSVLIGILLTYFFANTFASSLFILTGVAAGNLLYIATADLLPELRHAHRAHFLETFCVTILGVALIASLITYTHEQIPENFSESQLRN